jgi:segregation and condensation protein B
MVDPKSGTRPHQSPPAAHLGLESFRAPPADGGLSLDKLKGAFAAMLGSGDDPYSVPADPNDDPLRAAIVVEENAGDERSAAEVGCEINPRTILEAMLFVGLPDGRPLPARQVAALMRGVRPAEIDELVRDLNDEYARTGRPYRVASEGAGYRLALREQFAAVRDKFAGRVAQARLSAAAIEVLAVVAYNQPLTAEQISRMRDTPSGRILSQLVRRQLLRIDRDDSPKRSARYCTTERFLRLVGVESLADLPRSLDLDRR